jgi:hypothetical protein
LRAGDELCGIGLGSSPSRKFSIQNANLPPPEVVLQSAEIAALNFGGLHQNRRG